MHAKSENNHLLRKYMLTSIYEDILVFIINLLANDYNCHYVPKGQVFMALCTSLYVPKASIHLFK